MQLDYIGATDVTANRNVTKENGYPGSRFRDLGITRNAQAARSTAQKTLR